MYLELTEVNSNLAGILAPLLLGAAATRLPRLAAGPGGRAARRAGVPGQGRRGGRNTGVATAAGVAVGVTAAAAVATVVVGAGGPSPHRVVADPPGGTATTAPASPGTSPGTSPGERPSKESGSISPTSASTAAAIQPTTVAPSATVSALPGPSTGTPTDAPLDVAGDPTPTDTVEPAALPDRFIGEPVVDPAGFVTVETRNLRADDVVDVSLVSDETTLSDPATDAACRVVTGRHAVCTPGAADLRGGGQAVPTVVIGDYTVRLALDFPGYMLSDDVSVRVSVDGRTGSSSATRTFRPGRAASYDFAALRVTGPAAHTVTGDVDHYRFATTASLPPRVTGLRYELTGPGRFRPSDADGCTASEDRTVLRCPDVRRGDTVALPVDADGLTGTAVAGVAVSSLDGVVDTTPDDRTDTLTLRPGAELALDPQDLGALHAAQGDHRVALHLTGGRAGLPSVTYTAGDGVAVTGSSTPGCTVDDGRLTCAAPVPADTSLTVRSSTPDRTTPLTVSVSPGGDFVGLGADGTASGSLVASHDFAMSDLVQVGHTLTGDTDHYTLRSQVAAVPAAVDRLRFRLTGDGSFAADQDAGCTVVGARTLSCGDLGGGRTVDFAVDADGTTRPDVTVALDVPAGHDDPAPANDSGAIADLAPGVDLSLTSLQPDNSSPANDDDRHLVSTTLGGVRRGLPEVTYTLTGAATFVGADVAGCTAAGASLTCPGPVDGPVTFTVRANDPHQATDIAIAVAAPATYDELGPGDNAAAATLAARPTYDFALSPFEQTGHTVSGGTDTYTLRSTVAALPTASTG